MHAPIAAHLYKTPRRYVSDGRFTPEGTVQYKHELSVEGNAQNFYAPTDLTAGLNGSRDELDRGVAVDVVALVQFEVRNGKLQATDLVELRERAPADAS